MTDQDHLFTAHSASLLIPVAIAFAYISCLIIVLPHCWYEFMTDHISYIRVATYWAEGDFTQATNGSWSPLISWLLVPFIWLGFDPLLGWTLLASLSGLGLVFTGWFMFGRFGLSVLARALATSAIAGMALDYATRAENQDILVMAVLPLYLGSTLSPRIIEHRRTALGAGALAGLGYFAKNYILPFAVVHLALVCFLWAQALGKGLLSRLFWRQLMLGYLGLAIIVGPWIVALSWKYGRVTVGTHGAMSHATVAPTILERTLAGLRVQPGKVLNSWEDPELSGLRWSFWSPFASISAMGHQIKVAAKNLWWMAQALRALNAAGFFVTALLLAGVGALLLGLSQPVGMRQSWAIVSILAYISGYAMVYGSAERYYWPLVPIFVALLFQWVDWLRSPFLRDAEGIMPRRRPLAVGVLSAFLLLSCIPGKALVERSRLAELDLFLPNTAKQLLQEGIEGPIASNEWGTGLILSYFLNIKTAGVPLGKDPTSIVSEAQQAGVRTFILATSGESSAIDFSGHPEMERIAEYRNGEGKHARGIIAYRVSPLPSRDE
jgi:hypothetical protein